jgi:hypothetical protein
LITLGWKGLLFVSYGENKVLLVLPHIQNTLFYLYLTNASNKLEWLITLGWKGLPFVSYGENIVLLILPHIHHTLFYLHLTNASNKLEW